MASKAQFEVDADTEGAVQAIENIGRAAQSVAKDVKALEAEQKRAAQSAQREGEKSAQALEKVGQGAISALDQATGGLIGKFTGLYKNIKQVNLGFTGMKAAIAATGIGLLVVALGEIVANWENIVNFLNSASKSSQDLLKSTTDNAAAQQVKLDAISEQENILRAQGKTEAEIRDLKVQQTAETITALEAQILAQEAVKTAQVDAAERNRQILQGIIRFLTLPLSVLLGTIDMVGKALGKDFGLEEGFSGGLANLVFDPEEIATKGDEAIEETKKQLLKLKNTQAGYTLQANKEKLDRENTSKADGDKKKIADDAKLKSEQDYLDRVNTLLQSEDEKRILSVAKTYDDLIEQAVQYGADTTALEAARGVAIQEVLDAQAAERLAKQTAADAKVVADAKVITDKNIDDAEKEANALQAIRDLNLANTYQALGALGSLFEEGTAASKAAAVAEIAIRTGEGFVNGLGIAQKTALAAPAGTGAFIFPLFYAAQIASVLAAANQARKILGAGGGGGGNVTAPIVPSAPSVPTRAPQFNIVGRSETNQLATSIAGQGIVQAYVVGSDVTSQQALDRKRIRTATFG